METWIGIGLGVIIGLLLGVLLSAFFLLRIRTRTQQQAAERLRVATQQAQTEVLAEQGKLQALQDELRRVQNELKQAQTNLNTAQREQSTAQNELATLRPMLNRANSEKDNLLMDVIALRAENEQLRAASAAPADPVQPDASASED